MLERGLPSRHVPAESITVDVRQYAVVTDEAGRLLVLQYPSIYRTDARNRWTLPGGGLLVGEAPRAGIYRELMEETGLAPELGLNVRVHRPAYVKDRLWVLYRGFTDGADVRLSPEHEAFLWADGEALRGLEFYHGKLRDMAVEMLLAGRDQWMVRAAKRPVVATG